MQRSGICHGHSIITHITAGHTQQRWCLHMSRRFHELGRVPGHMPQAPCQAHESNLTYASTNRYCACTCKNVRQDHFAYLQLTQLQYNHKAQCETPADAYHIQPDAHTCQACQLSMRLLSLSSLPKGQKHLQRARHGTQTIWHASWSNCHVDIPTVLWLLLLTWPAEPHLGWHAYLNSI